MDTLARVKIRLGIPVSDTSHDDLLHLKIEDAERFFKDYCKREDIPPQARGIIEQLVVSLHSSHGGVQSEKVGDTSTTYFEDAIPNELKIQLNRYRRVLIY